MLYEAETWVAIAFVILMAVFAYVGVHRTVLTALDNRAARIKAELDEARKLKDDAAKVLAEYKTRRAAAEREAEEQQRAGEAQGHGGLASPGVPLRMPLVSEPSKHQPSSLSSLLAASGGWLPSRARVPALGPV